MNVKSSLVCRIAVGAALMLGIARATKAQEPVGAVCGPDRIENGALRLESGSLLSVELTEGRPWKRMHANSVLEGRLTLPLYSGQSATVPAGTKVRLTIESVRKLRDSGGVWRRSGRAIIAAFKPLDSTAPVYQFTLHALEIQLPDGVQAIRASVLRAGWVVQVQPREPRNEKTARALPSSESRKRRQMVVLRLDDEVSWTNVPVAAKNTNSGVGADPEAASAASPSVINDRRARAFLLSDLSASRSREGDRFQAQLAEPIRLAGIVFETGSLIEGVVMHRQGPRILSRAGSLYLRIDHIHASQGPTLAVAGTLRRAEADSAARFVMDEEGQLSGRAPGFVSGLVDVSIAYAVGKVTDDIAETPIRAIGAATSNAAVANAARYFGLSASAAFLVTRHGRDVHLAKYAEIEVDFGDVPRESILSSPSEQ